MESKHGNENDIGENPPPRNNHRKGKNPERKRHGARNQHRHKQFVKWLIETFSLQSKDDNTKTTQIRHVLDVAGGKGEVSARLCMCHLQNVVMVDPRPADIVHCYEKLGKFIVSSLKL